jgi:hypothetical protein
MTIRLLPALVAALFATVPALAYDEPDRCYTTSDPRCSGDDCGNTFYNPSVTQNWMQTRQNADAKVMQSVAGVYYGEFPSSDGSMYEQVYRSYEASGLWQYRDQTCTTNNQAGIPCSQNQGAGQWAAYSLNDGTIFLMIHFSDLSRSNNCFSQTIRLGNGGFSDTAGGSWRRVQ